MTTADWAIVISIGALTISFMGFVWNVWSTFIYPKPKLSVYLSSVISLDIVGGQDIDTADNALRLSAVNHGPGPIEITQVLGRLWRKPIWKKPAWAILRTYGHWPHNQNSNHIGGFDLPKRLEVGESHDQFLRPHENNYEEIVKFGFSDSFGRTHWANAKSVRKTKTSIASEEDK